MWRSCQLAAAGDGSGNASGLAHPQFALLVMYLFHMAAPAVQKHVLRSVDDCFMTVRALWFVLCVVE